MKRAYLIDPDFGKRLASFRKECGLTQTQLGELIGITKRMMAYYEGQTNRPPAKLLIPLSKALKVSVEQMLGEKKITYNDPANAKLWRRLKKAESLPSKDQKRLFDFLEVLLRSSNLKK